jgi:adenine-specific DNA methylase
MGLKPNDLASYRNHYNSMLNKCFIDTESTTTAGQSVLTLRNHFDVLEGKDYGTYIWRNPGDKKYWEVTPSKCEVVGPTGDAQTCSSNDEFSTLAKAYMEG